jgi:hypothetical protein
MAINVRYQALLRDLQLYDGEIDGKYGPKTKAALIKFQRLAGLIATGIVDPQTQTEFENQLRKMPDRTQEPIRKSLIDAPYKRWPKETTDELLKFYGNVGENQIVIDLPYKMFIAWDPKKSINKVSCHKKVADSLVRVLENIKKTYKPNQISEYGFDKFGGMLNVRKIRGGNRWSTHAWGIAIDLDPARNGLQTPWSGAYFSRPECSDFVNCFRQEGWYSLGLEKNYDAMHFQACWR